jgi:hypothetical protein
MGLRDLAPVPGTGTRHGRASGWGLSLVLRDPRLLGRRDGELVPNRTVGRIYSRIVPVSSGWQS